MKSVLTPLPMDCRRLSSRSFPHRVLMHGLMLLSLVFPIACAGGSDVGTAANLQNSSKNSSVIVNSDSMMPLGPSAAFPGAEGMGAGATGGRGGVVYTVNTLTDSYHEGTTNPTPWNGPNGPTCTLRDALQAEGTRTVVFSVGGTITLHGPIYPIPDNLTIAGQTAPGGGIQVKGDGTFGHGGAMLHTTGANTIIRYMRFRPGSGPTTSDGQGLSAISSDSETPDNQIYDHCSFEWDGNKPIGFGGIVTRITLSWNLMGEGLYTGPLVNGGPTGIDSSSIDGHHNIFAMYDHRVPYTNNKYFRWVNNLTFGYNYAGLVRGNVHADIIGNVFDGGMSSNLVSNSGMQEFRWADTAAHNEDQYVPGGDAAQFFMSNNFGPHNTNGASDNFDTMLRIAANENGQLNNNPVDTQYKVSGPTSMPSSLNSWPITVSHLTAYSDLKGILAPTVGAYRRLAADGSWVANRDTVDAKIIGYIMNPSTSPNALVSAPGTYPTLDAGTPYASSLGDGISDSWKTSHGLSTTDSSVANTIRPNANGYTNLELYLSGLFPNGTPLP